MKKILLSFFVLASIFCNAQNSFYTNNKELIDSIRAVTIGRSIAYMRNDSVFGLMVNAPGDTVFSFRYKSVGAVKYNADSLSVRVKVLADSTALATAINLRKLNNDSTATSGFESRGKFKNDSTVLAAATALKLNIANPVATGILTAPSIKFGRRSVADVNATIATSDFLIAYTSMTAARTVTLPTASTATNQYFIIKDESGSASVINTLSIVGTVDGTANPVVITIGRGLYRIYSNGTNWFTW